MADAPQLTVGSTQGVLAGRRWWLALTISLLAHVLFLASPGWRLPLLDDLLGTDKEERIEARLAPPPAAVAVAPPPVAVAPPPAARPEPPPTPKRQLPPRAPVAPARPAGSTLGVPTFSPPAPPPAVVPLAPAAAVAPAPVAVAPLLQRVRLRFAIIRGDQGFVVGRSEHRWTLEGGAYTLRAVTETTGLAALFKPAKVTQVSEGELLAEGLRPRSFRVERSGAVGDTASFDWAAGRVAMSPGPRDASTEPGMQDMLSMFWQVGLMPVSPIGMAVTVATGKKIERFVFALVGEEKIATALGERTALHLKTVGTAGGDATEVWIGVEKRLPLRIRHVDRKGEVFDQIVDELEME